MSSALPFRRNREKSFIITWPGDDIVELRFLGETICAPPIGAIAEAKKGRFRFGSAQDERGNYISGTVVIKDRFETTPEGAKKVFDAEYFLFGENIEGQGLTGTNEALMARGLMVVDDVSQVAEAHRIGREMWEEKQAIADDELLRNELARRQRHAINAPGAPVPVALDDQAVKAAAERQKQRTTRNRPSVSDDDLVSALGGVSALGAAARPPVTTKAPVAPVADEALSPADIASHLWKAAKSHSVTLSKPQQQALLDQDPAGMEEVRAVLEGKGIAF